MHILNRLLNPMQHCEDSAAYLLNSLGIKFTRSHLQKELLEHPDYPSLMSIADVIGISYNIASVPLKIQRKNILEAEGINAPFIAHIKSPQAEQVFSVVTSFSKEAIDLYDPGTKRNETFSPEEFDKQYLGTILLVEAEGNAQEDGYHQHVKEENFSNLRSRLLTFSLPTLTLIICLITFLTAPTNIVVASIGFTLATLVGCITGVLLLWHEVDAYNPALIQICQAGKKVNCSAILDSKAARVFGVSWSAIGFGYFAGMLMVLLTGGITSPAVLEVLSWINVLALPYVGFSIFYQWKIAKQWCPLCVTTQGLLLLQFVAAFAGGFHRLLSIKDLPGSLWLSIIGSFGFVYTATFLLMPALEKAKEARRKTIELQRLKHNPQVFEALLTKQRSIETPPPNLGITIGNPNGAYRLIKVCNPYCGPCAKAHSVIEALAENNQELSLQIIFNATEDNNDYRKQAVSHLLAIDAKNNKALTKQALDDWYNAPVKEYAAFAMKYPMNGEIVQQEEKIKRMAEWCTSAAIPFTPSFFLCLNTADSDVQFYQLPRQYTVTDLRYFLAQ